jgi:hypothetical protein
MIQIRSTGLWGERGNCHRVSVYDNMPCVVEMYRCCLGKLSSVDSIIVLMTR